MTQKDFKKLIRLYVSSTPLVKGEQAALSDDHHHYLRNVMRLESGDSLRLFNGQDGDWRAEVVEMSKKKAVVAVVEQLSEQRAAPDIFVLCATVKKEALDLMVEKSCELGAALFQPVITDHSAVHKVNDARLQDIATGAAEQSERQTVMQVEPLKDLKSVLNSWDKNRKIMFCIERREAPLLIREAVAGTVKPPVGILIGPEGGFSEAEVSYLLGLDFVVPVSLGATVLRAETAMMAAMLCVQAGLES